MTKPIKKEALLKRSSFLPRTRCTKADRLSVETKALQAGLSLSEYQRQILVKGKVIVRQSKIELEVVRQLSAIGHNLNQLTKGAHINSEYNKKELLDILDKINQVVMKVINDSEN